VKIAYISNSFLPSRAANTVHVLKMCDAFASNDHVVRLFVRCRNGPTPADEIKELYGLEQRLDVRCVRERRWKRWIHMYALIATLRARAWGAEIIYSRLLSACYFGALLRAPVVFEAHKPVVGRLDSWMFRYLARSARLKRVVVISRALKEEFVARAADLESRILVAPDGADPIPEDMLPDWNPSRSGRLRIGYIGHLYPGKGMELIPVIARRLDWAEFRIIGGTNADINRWRGILADLLNVEFEGYLPHAAAISRAAQFDVLIAPYLRNAAQEDGQDIARWMSPLKLFEYMATGRPIICSDLPVLAEVLEHERDAILCDPDDPDQWVAALTRLRQDPDLRARLGANARRRLHREFTWSRRAAAVLEGGLT
jgi:glycosyltransferase involved in cell wall biosynthesis